VAELVYETTIKYFTQLYFTTKKAPGLSGLVTEMIQATGDTGTQWILDLCNGIVKKEVSLTTGNLVWYCQSTKAKVTLWSVDLIEGLNCWNML